MRGGFMLGLMLFTALVYGMMVGVGVWILMAQP